MRTDRLGLAIALSILSVAARAAELDATFVGPPLYTVNGCPANVEWNDVIVAKAVGLTPWEFVKMRDLRGLDYDDFCRMDGAKFSRAKQKATSPPQDHPMEANRFRRLQEAGDDGTVKGDGLIVATQQRNAMLPPPGTKVAGIHSNSWTEIGPSNIGGRIRAISPDPANANNILAGSVTGGIFKSTNGGTTWQPVNDFMGNLAVSALARAPSNSLLIFAGTGEGFTFDTRGYGVFRSTDNGATWTQLANTTPDATDPPATRLSDFAYINRIAVHPTNPDIVLVGTNGYYCNWGGLYRSTNATQATPTFTRVYDHRVGDVRFNPNNGNEVVVGEAGHCFDFGAGFVNAGGAVAYSSNAGATFTRVSLTGVEAAQRVEVSWAAATTSLVLAILDSNGGSGGYGQLYKSTNSGATWTYNSTPGNLGNQGWYANALWVDPTNSTRILVGGLDLYAGAGVASWWIANTAVVWTKVSTWQFAPTSPHADHHFIGNAPGYNGTTNLTVYNGNDGGIYSAANIGTVNANASSNGWTNLNSGLNVTQFYSVAGKNYGASTVIVGGTQDNGSLKAPAAGTSWTTFFGGDGGASAVDPADPNYYYGEYVYATLHRASTGGFSSVICNGTADNVGNITEGGSRALAYPNSYCGTLATSEANFIAPFVLDPNNANTMYVGAKSLWRSTTAKAAAPTWSIVKAATSPVSYISAIAVAPGNSNIVWVGHNNGQIWCTINGGGAWTQVTSPGSRMVMRFLIDPSNLNRVFVSFGGYTSPNLYELTDATQVCKAAPTTTARHNNLPQAPVRSIVRHPTNANYLYVGTNVGIFASTNGGVSWSTPTDGPGNIPVDELAWIDGTTLVMGTYGRGMFKATVSAGTVQFTQATVNVAETAPNVSLSVSRSAGDAGPIGVSYGTANGSGVAGTNYTTTSGSLSWLDTDTTTQSFNVPILNDNLAAGNKTFTVTLSSPTGGATIGATGSTTVTILDAGAGVPGAPQTLAATAGNTQATFTFLPPASNGGSPITSYTVTCNPGAKTGTGPASPITVTGLTNLTLYSCTATATNASGVGAASNTATVTPSAGATLTLVAVQSRKTHGGAGTFDFPIDAAALIGGNVTVEPRQINTGHAIVFQFNAAITATGTAACVDKNAVPVGAAVASFSGNEITVTLTGIPDNQRVTVSLTNVNGAGVNASASIGFLVGDVNNTRSVTAADILVEKFLSGFATDSSNFKSDLNVNGSISAADILAAKFRSGTALPP